VPTKPPKLVVTAPVSDPAPSKLTRPTDTIGIDVLGGTIFVAVTVSPKLPASERTVHLGVNEELSFVVALVWAAAVIAAATIIVKTVNSFTDICFKLLFFICIDSP